MDELLKLEEQLENMPYSLEAEQSVLGGILIEPEIITVVLEYITKPEMFYRKQHRNLFSVFMNMFNTSKTIDVITVLDECKKSSVFDSDEGAKSYLVQLMELVPTTANISNYCKIVQEKYYIRTLMVICAEISDKAKAGDVEAQTLLELAEQRIYDIRQGKDTTGLSKIDTVIIEAYDRLLKMSGEDADKYLGLKSGFHRLDMITAGLNKSDLILVAARPGMGKSSFAMNIATNVAIRYPDRDVAVFSLEMSNEQLVTRVLSSEAKIKSEKMRIGKLEPDEWIRLAGTADRLSKANMYLDDSAGVTVSEIKAKLRRLPNIGLVVVDYLQLMSSGKRTENRVQEISQMTRNFKILAKELDIPVILLSQLSRAAEQRQGHQPMLSDLRDSGSIEQDADIVLFLYRDDYYEDGDEGANKNTAKCIVAKNRHGSTGEVELSWVGEYTRFDNLETRYDEPF